MPHQAIIVRFNKTLKALAQLEDLENRLDVAASESGLGIYDGSDAPTDFLTGYLYLYGADADALFQVVKPVLEAFSAMDGAVARLRYGPAKRGVRESQVELRSTHQAEDELYPPIDLLPIGLPARP
jgi:hypothetical protein